MLLWRCKYSSWSILEYIFKIIQLVNICKFSHYKAYPVWSTKLISINFICVKGPHLTTFLLHFLCQDSRRYDEVILRSYILYYHSLELSFSSMHDWLPKLVRFHIILREVIAWFLVFYHRSIVIVWLLILILLESKISNLFYEIFYQYLKLVRKLISDVIFWRL